MHTVITYSNAVVSCQHQRATTLVCQSAKEHVLALMWPACQTPDTDSMNMTNGHHHKSLEQQQQQANTSVPVDVCPVLQLTANVVGLRRTLATSQVNQ